MDIKTALNQLLRASFEECTARQQFDGQDWDAEGYKPVIQARQAAENRFFSALEARLTETVQLPRASSS